VVLALFAKICYIATKFVYYIRQESRLLVTLQSERVGWNELDVSSVYCIRHVASNLNKQFKNIDLKKQVINIGMFLPISCIIFLLYYMFIEFITHCSIFSHRV